MARTRDYRRAQSARRKATVRRLFVDCWGWRREDISGRQVGLFASTRTPARDTSYHLWMDDYLAARRAVDWRRDWELR